MAVRTTSAGMVYVIIADEKNSIWYANHVPSPMRGRLSDAIRNKVINATVAFIAQLDESWCFLVIILENKNKRIVSQIIVIAGSTTGIASPNRPYETEDKILCMYLPVCVRES